MALGGSDFSPTQVCYISLVPKRPRGNWPSRQSPPCSGGWESAGLWQASQLPPGDPRWAFNTVASWEKRLLYLPPLAGVLPWSSLQQSDMSCREETRATNTPPRWSSSQREECHSGQPEHTPSKVKLLEETAGKPTKERALKEMQEIARVNMNTRTHTHTHRHTHRLSRAKNMISHLNTLLDKLKESYWWSGKSNWKVISKHRAKIREQSLGKR